LLKFVTVDVTALCTRLPVHKVKRQDHTGSSARYCYATLWTRVIPDLTISSLARPDLSGFRNLNPAGAVFGGKLVLGSQNDAS